MFRARVTCSLLAVLLSGIVFSQGNAGNYAVRKLALNSPQNDYSPMVKNGELFFTSDSRQRVGIYYSSTDSSAALSNLFHAAVVNDTLFGTPELIDHRLNRFYNCGPASISNDFSRIYFSSNEETKFVFYTSKKKSKLKIYSSQKEQKNWSERELAAFCADTNNYTHPCLSDSGDTLWFASDRPGGFGGYDLYYVVSTGDSWSSPVNLGAAINSADNEVFPYVKGERIWFSSNRKGGFGGLDLYVSESPGAAVKLLETPFNSPQDDFGIFLSDNKKGYFTSNRGGSDDIYFFRELFPSFRNCEPYVKDPFCYTFFEETADELDDSLNLEYEWNLGDGTLIKGEEAKHCFADYGEYLVELNIIDKTTSEIFYTQTTYPFSIEHSERLHIEGPDTVQTGVQAKWLARNSVVPDHEILDYYWEIDGTTRVLNADSLEKTFETEGPHELLMGVEARSFTTGEEQTFCVTKTIVVSNAYVAPVRIVKPVVAKMELSGDTLTPELYTLFLGASDSLLNGINVFNDDTLRVENIGDSLYLYSVGASPDKFDFMADYHDAKRMGFSDSQVTGLKNDTLIRREKFAQTALVPIERIVENRILQEEVVASYEIFYDFNVFLLTPENRKKLAAFAAKYRLKSGQRVLIVSFTDSKGNSDYNLELSKKRSVSVQNELILNGYTSESTELEYFGKRVPLEMEPYSDAQRRKSLIIIYEKK